MKFKAIPFMVDKPENQDNVIVENVTPVPHEKVVSAKRSVGMKKRRKKRNIVRAVKGKQNEGNETNSLVVQAEKETVKSDLKTEKKASARARSPRRKKRVVGAQGDGGDSRKGTDLEVKVNTVLEKEKMIKPEEEEKTQNVEAVNREGRIRHRRKAIASSSSKSGKKTKEVETNIRSEMDTGTSPLMEGKTPDGEPSHCEVKIHHRRHKRHSSKSGKKEKNVEVENVTISEKGKDGVIQKEEKAPGEKVTHRENDNPSHHVKRDENKIKTEASDIVANENVVTPKRRKRREEKEMNTGPVEDKVKTHHRHSSRRERRSKEADEHKIGETPQKTEMEKEKTVGDEKSEKRKGMVVAEAEKGEGKEKLEKDQGKRRHSSKRHKESDGHRHSKHSERHHTSRKAEDERVVDAHEEKNSEMGKAEGKREKSHSKATEHHRHRRSKESSPKPDASAAEGVKLVPPTSDSIKASNTASGKEIGVSVNDQLNTASQGTALLGSGNTTGISSVPSASKVTSGGPPESLEVPKPPIADSKAASVAKVPPPIPRIPRREVRALPSPGLEVMESFPKFGALIQAADNDQSTAQQPIPLQSTHVRKLGLPKYSPGHQAVPLPLSQPSAGDEPFPKFNASASLSYMSESQPRFLSRPVANMEAFPRANVSPSGRMLEGDAFPSLKPQESGPISRSRAVTFVGVEASAPTESDDNLNLRNGAPAQELDAQPMTRLRSRTDLGLPPLPPTNNQVEEKFPRLLPTNNGGVPLVVHQDGIVGRVTGKSGGFNSSRLGNDDTQSGQESVDGFRKTRPQSMSFSMLDSAPGAKNVRFGGGDSTPKPDIPTVGSLARVASSGVKTFARLNLGSGSRLSPAAESAGDEGALSKPVDSAGKNLREEGPAKFPAAIPKRVGLRKYRPGTTSAGDLDACDEAEQNNGLSLRVGAVPVRVRGSMPFEKEGTSTPMTLSAARQSRIDEGRKRKLSRKSSVSDLGPKTVFLENEQVTGK
jgi:hypothetical protein